MVRTSVARKLRAAGTSSSAAALAISSAQEKMNSRSTHLRTGMSHHQQHNLAMHSDSATNNNMIPDVLITPPPPSTPPLLLLEGDEMFISRAGKSRTVYHLKEAPNRILEETYDIEKAQKKMSLLEPSKRSSSNELTDIFSFDLQEINHGVQNGSGTGSMSWDSGIVMGLYFAANPDELCGNVLELGSGVGLGGILSNVATNIFHGDSKSAHKKRRVTLTDVSDDVLDVLQQNMNAAVKKSSLGVCKDNLSIQKLDWFDFLGSSESPPDDDAPSKQHSDARYDTILASDCAYLNSQITPLSETISKLLGHEREEKLHMFAPYNRGIVHDLVEDLNKKDMHVKVEDLEMSKYRIKQDGIGATSIRGQFWNDGPDKPVGDNNMTCGVSKFLHITAWHKTGLDGSGGRTLEDRMVDID